MSLIRRSAFSILFSVRQSNSKHAFRPVVIGVWVLLEIGGCVGVFVGR